MSFILIRKYIEANLQPRETSKIRSETLPDRDEIEVSFGDSSKF